MHLVVSEMCYHPEENSGVIWGFFLLFFLFFLDKGQWLFSVLSGYAFENFDVLRMLVYNACIPLLFLVCKLTFINFTFFIYKQNQVSKGYLCISLLYLLSLEL